ncbi:MAG TPA: hypothetical protein VK625_12405, partial [Flavitalea sp.]|nr:hypothetical protein [Flavitalea sp.]
SLGPPVGGMILAQPLPPIIPEITKAEMIAKNKKLLFMRIANLIGLDKYEDVFAKVWEINSCPPAKEGGERSERVVVFGSVN